MRIDPSQRTTQSEYARALKVLRTTFRKAIKGKAVCAHRSTMKPTLTEQNKAHRFMYCSGEINPNGIFKNMYDWVHVDKKWFFVDKVTRRCYLITEEKDPHRTTKHYVLMCCCPSKI